MTKSKTSPYARRREDFFAAIENDSVALIPTSPVPVRNHDVEYKFRPDSDFYYLTGFREPHSLAVLVKRGRSTRFVLFVPPRNKAQEIWTGRRAGVEGAKREFGADEAFEFGKLQEELPKILKGAKNIYYKIGRDSSLDANLPKWLEWMRAQIRAGVEAPTAVLDPSEILHEMRLRKSEEEIALMRKAAEITMEAHHQAMIEAKPGVGEHEIEALVDYTFRRRGAEGTAYPSIVASGPNACILHYVDNNRKMEKGDLLLLDAGAEFGSYAGDVTRTYPINGRFTKAQEAVYRVVLDAQMQCVEMVKPGVKFHDIHDHAVRALTEGMVELGLLKGRVEKLIKSNAYQRFYMHRTGHWLGMDVHDRGRYYVEGKSRLLEPGMVLTVEPGLYIEEGARGVDKDFWGIGVRIEDDILVTKSGHENLTKGIVKSVKEVEEMCSR